MSPLAGIAASLVVALPARGGEVPFTERVISTAADAARSVFATDMDGDGDTDVLSASQHDDKIAWYESDGGTPPTFTERVISTTADTAKSVFATDVDGDGDTDVLSASAGDGKIAWYESDGGSPPTFTERVISTAADLARSVFATDLDGDGDTDVLSASVFDDKIAWYENTTPLDPTVLLENVVQQVLALNLQQGIENSLDAKLDAAQQALQDVNDNNDVAACNTLQAFINAVDAQGGNQIPQDDADALSAAVQEILVALGCS